jgi:hypothetical protein
MAALQNNSRITFGESLDGRNAIHSDDRSAVNPNESGCVELRLDSRNSIAYKVGVRTHMEREVIALCLNPVNTREIDELNAAPCFYGNVRSAPELRAARALPWPLQRSRVLEDTGQREYRVG